MSFSKESQTILQAVLATVDREHQKRLGRPYADPTYGEFVALGLSLDARPERHVGFVVQIRRKAGQFGSDMVFLRHPDGMLVTHENQSFYMLTPEQEAIVRTVCLADHLPEDEKADHGYACCAKVREKGFIVERSASPAAPVQPVRLTVSRGDGSQEHVVIV